MNAQILQNLCDQIYRRFPQTQGKQPKVQNRPGEQVLLIFRGEGRAADGHTIPTTVRVVASVDGKIIKVSTSR